MPLNPPIRGTSHTVQQTSAPQKSALRRTPPPSPRPTDRRLEQAMTPGAVAPGGRDIQPVGDVELWRSIQENEYPTPALVRQGLMSLFDESFAGLQTRTIYADQIVEYVEARLNELDELSMHHVTELRDTRGESLSAAMSLAHSERRRPLGSPHKSDLVEQQFPELTLAMDNLMTTLVRGGVLDGEEMASLIEYGRFSPAAERPDEGESSGSDRDRIRHPDEAARMLYALSLDTEDEARAKTSNVTETPRRKLGRGGARGQDPGETAAIDANSDKFAKTRHDIDGRNRRNDPFERHGVGFSILPDVGGKLSPIEQSGRQVHISHRELRPYHTPGSQEIELVFGGSQRGEAAKEIQESS